MSGLNVILTWILEIAGVAVILFAVAMWVLDALKGHFATSVFMALTASIVFYIVVILGYGRLTSPYIFWFTVVYGGIAVFYIVTHMIERVKGAHA